MLAPKVGVIARQLVSSREVREVREVSAFTLCGLCELCMRLLPCFTNRVIATPCIRDPQFPSLSAVRFARNTEAEQSLPSVETSLVAFAIGSFEGLEKGDSANTFTLPDSETPSSESNSIRVLRRRVSSRSTSSPREKRGNLQTIDCAAQSATTSATIGKWSLK